MKAGTAQMERKKKNIINCKPPWLKLEVGGAVGILLLGGTIVVAAIWAVGRTQFHNNKRTTHQEREEKEEQEKIDEGDLQKDLGLGFLSNLFPKGEPLLPPPPSSKDETGLRNKEDLIEDRVSIQENGFICETEEEEEDLIKTDVVEEEEIGLDAKICNDNVSVASDSDKLHILEAVANREEPVFCIVQAADDVKDSNEEIVEETSAIQYEDVVELKLNSEVIAEESSVVQQTEEETFEDEVEETRENIDFVEEDETDSSNTEESHKGDQVFEGSSEVSSVDPNSEAIWPDEILEIERDLPPLELIDTKNSIKMHEEFINKLAEKFVEEHQRMEPSKQAVDDEVDTVMLKPESKAARLDFITKIDSNIFQLMVALAVVIAIISFAHHDLLPSLYTKFFEMHFTKDPQ